ncbi:unnamed protein product, partial [Rotaria sp. Silwood1]
AASAGWRAGGGEAACRGRPALAPRQGQSRGAAATYRGPDLGLPLPCALLGALRAKEGRRADRLPRAQEPLCGRHAGLQGRAASRQRPADADARADFQHGRARPPAADRAGDGRRGHRAGAAPPEPAAGRRHRADARVRGQARCAVVAAGQGAGHGQAARRRRPATGLPPARVRRDDAVQADRLHAGHPRRRLRPCALQPACLRPHGRREPPVGGLVQAAGRVGRCRAESGAAGHPRRAQLQRVRQAGGHRRLPRQAEGVLAPGRGPLQGRAGCGAVRDPERAQRRGRCGLERHAGREPGHHPRDQPDPARRRRPQGLELDGAPGQPEAARRGQAPRRHLPLLHADGVHAPGRVVDAAVPEAVRGRPRQQQPGDDHDGPGHGRRHLHRTDHLAGRREDHRQGAPGRRAADDGRPDGAELRAGPAQARRAGQVQRRDDRCQRARHREGRGPPEVQGRDDQDRPGLGPVGHRALDGRSAVGAEAHPGRDRRQRLPHEAAARAGPQAAAEPHRAHRRPSRDAGQRDRLPAGRAPQLCAGRPRDGDRSRRQGSGALHARSCARQREVAGAAGPLPAGRCRGRRGLHLRHHGRRDDRRHHGARGSGWHPLRRLGLLAAAVHAVRRSAGRAAPPDGRDGQGAEGRRLDERAVRHPGRRDARPVGLHDLRAGSEPACVAHRAVREQGHRPAARQDRRALHGGPEARRPA